MQRHAWLAGDTFTLADISMTPYVNRLDMLGMSEMWSRSRPHPGGLVRARQGTPDIHARASSTTARRT